MVDPLAGCCHLGILMTAGAENRVLASIVSEGFGALLPPLETVSLASGEILESSGLAIDYVFFPRSCVASVMAGTGDYRLEVGMIGLDGMTGSAIILGANTSPHECLVRVPGEAVRIATTGLKHALDASPGLRSLLLTYFRAFLRQPAETALAAGRSTIAQRLARLVLMLQDRLGGSDVYLTHEHLASMLGVRRPGVTVALHTLEGAGTIRNRRGSIKILDRTGLETAAGLAYRSPDWLKA